MTDCTNLISSCLLLPNFRVRGTHHCTQNFPQTSTCFDPENHLVKHPNYYSCSQHQVAWVLHTPQHLLTLKDSRSAQTCHSLEVAQYPLHTVHNGTLLVLQEEGHQLQIQTKASHLPCTSHPAPAQPFLLTSKNIPDNTNFASHISSCWISVNGTLSMVRRLIHLASAQHTHWLV